MYTASMSEQSWVPLESNSDVLNKYVNYLGVPENTYFVDIYGLEKGILLMVPRPVLAVLLLFQITEKTEANPIGEVQEENSLFCVKQTTRNASGTVAIVHSLANNKENLDFEDGKPLKKFLKETVNMSPEERGEYLEKDTDMGAAHESTAQEGQTQAPSREEVNKHFVVFVHKDGGLYELDGRKDGPTFHGVNNKDTLLEDAIRVVRRFMERDPEQLNFNLMALIKSE